MKIKAAVTGLIACAATVAFGDVGYRIDGGDPQVAATPNGVFDITVGTNLVGSHTMHIFTVGGGSSASLDSIIVRGTVSPNESAGVNVVKVVVADAGISSANLAFVDPQRFFQPGLHNVGGVHFLPPEGSFDESLRTHSVLSLNVQGNVTGEVMAGMLFRVYVLSDINNNGGRISGILHSTRGDGNALGVDGLLRPSICYVHADLEMSGIIIADGERDANGVLRTRKRLPV